MNDKNSGFFSKKNCKKRARSLAASQFLFDNKKACLCSCIWRVRPCGNPNMKKESSDKCVSLCVCTRDWRVLSHGTLQAYRFACVSGGR